MKTTPNPRRRLVAGAALAALAVLAPTAAWSLPQRAGTGGIAAICADPPCPPATTTTRRPTTTTTRPPNTFNWFLDANTLHVIDNQELFSDEAYIAQIGFRSTPGVAGSTTTWYQGGLSEMGDLDEGESHTIPDAMGRVRIPNVTTRSRADLEAGRRWEIVGTASVVFESDLTPFSTINAMMQDVAVATRTAIANAIEPLPAAGVSVPLEVAALLAPLSDGIKVDTSISLGQKIAIFLGSLGDPDDLVATRVQFFVALDGSYSLLDNLLGALVRNDVGVAGTLHDRSHAINFAGDGASYTIDFAVSHS